MKERNLRQRQAAADVPAPAATNFPVGQAVQESDSSTLYLLASHVVQDVACTPRLKVPAPQGLHSPLASFRELPVAQLAAMLE